MKTSMKILNQNQIKNLDDKELYKYCQFVGGRSHKWKRLFVATLPEVARRKLYKKRKFYSIYEFAAKVGGISKNVVDEALRVDEKLKDKPCLKALIPKVGLSKLRVVANVAEKETDKFWAERVESMTKNTVETYIRELKKASRMVGQHIGGNKNQQSLPGEFLGNANKDVTLTEDDNGQLKADFHLPDFDDVSKKNDGYGGCAEPRECEANNRKHFGFKIDNNVELKLRLFQRWLEKKRGEAVEFNEVINALLEIAILHSNFGKSGNFFTKIKMHV